MKSEHAQLPRFLKRLALVTIAATLAQGCATVKEGFAGSEHEEIAPFAQKTVEVIGVGDIILREDELVYLRRYAEGDFPELERLQQMLARVDEYRDAVIIYAVDMVRVTEQYRTEEGKVAAFANSIDSRLRDRGIGRSVVSESEWDTLLADVRRQPDLLAALRAFQPFVNKSSAAFELLINDIEDDAMPALRAEFDRRVQNEYKELLEFLYAQYEVRDDILAAMTALQRHRYGDSDAIATFRSTSSPVAREFFTKSSFSDRELRDIERELRLRLGDNTVLLAQFDKDVDDYEKTRAELDAAEASVYAELGIARVQIVTWSRAHQALANGVKEPGKWMESALKAAKAVKDIVK